MLPDFQKASSSTSKSDAYVESGVMPAKFCSGGVCCNNHQKQTDQEKDSRENECKDFVIIGKIKYLFLISCNINIII